MLPANLKAEDFTNYPSAGREFAVAHLALLRRLPVTFVPILLREVIGYDWKFPPEQQALKDQCDFLESLDEKRFAELLAGFSKLTASDELVRADWVNRPSQFVESLTAYLWSTHQIDAFHDAAREYAHQVREAKPPAEPVMARLGIVVIGRGCTGDGQQLFRRLRREGVYFSKFKSEGAFEQLLALVKERAANAPVPYAHWYIDGEHAAPVDSAQVTTITYAGLETARAALLKRLAGERGVTSTGPELVRTTLAQIRPRDLGMSEAEGVALINRFQVSLLTEGSGTQIFSTTFVQWAAREVLRRAQPLTLLARYTPRQREQQMNELLFGQGRDAELDPAGSLMDADMGAYYTWLNQQRLTGSTKSSFIAFFEDHNEAVVIGPALPRATVSAGPTDVAKIVSMIA